MPTRRRTRMIHRLARLGVAALAILGVAIAHPAAAAGISVMTDAGGIAIGGYDPVAYFTDTRALAGKPEFSAEWQGAVWRFASAAHRDLFLADPARYAPRYGGWCAYGVTMGVAAEADPAEGWTLYDGRLYFAYDAGTRARWSQDIAANLAAADTRWPAIEAGLLDGTAKIYRK